uniref:8.9 kDa family member n=1 Tax=Rhipicephalus appendiculatus TaxID=34631 RepID=A0A131YU02_RHIAP
MNTEVAEVMVLLIFAVLIGSIYETSCTIPKDGTLRIRDRFCEYRNRTIYNGPTESLKLRSPCERWTCNGDNKTMTIEGCPPPPPYDRAPPMPDPAPWPFCCGLFKQDP